MPLTRLRPHRAKLPAIAALLCASVGLLLAAPQAPRAAHTFAVKGASFVYDGTPLVIRAGEMHYPRIPRAYWRDRMQKARAMGLNTISTYVFWNLHEPTAGVWDTLNSSFEYTTGKGVLRLPTSTSYSSQAALSASS